jgi:hypothetical protein
MKKKRQRLLVPEASNKQLINFAATMLHKLGSLTNISNIYDKMFIFSPSIEIFVDIHLHFCIKLYYIFSSSAVLRAQCIG